MARTLANIVALIRQKLNFHDSLDEDIITSTIDLIQTRYEAGNGTFPLPWFCFDYTATLTTTTDQRYVTLGSDFVAFDEDFPLLITDADGDVHDLVRKPLYFLNQYRDLEGFPEAYEKVASTLQLFPIPDDEYTINIPHFKLGDALSGETNSTWFDFLTDLLVGEVALELASDLKDPELMQMLERRVVQFRADYVRKCEAEKHVLKQYVKGSMDA